MSLRSEIIEAVNSGMLPKRFSCQDIKQQFGRKYSKGYLACHLSNSEVITSDHSPTYKKYVVRQDVGVYELHPSLLTH